MKVKTHELVGISLDAAVALALGGANLRHDTVCTWWVTIDGKDRALSSGWPTLAFCPSTNWAHAGPIIEAGLISTDWDKGRWNASDEKCPAYHSADTLLVAAMRCFVDSKLGAEVELPDALAVTV